MSNKFHLCTPESGQPICGNGLVEPGEECDCGYSDQCRDQCCYDANQADNKKCKLKPNKVCRYITKMCLVLIARPSFEIFVSQHLALLPAVPARDPVAPLSAATRGAMRSAGTNPSALIRACATEWAPSARRPNPKPTSPLVTARLKSA